jgi:ABC-type dipeptide/oligopeptide/nickel transport system permease component
MASYLALRFGQSLVVIWIVATVVFMLVRITPGDPARQIASPDASEADVSLIRDELGLNDSLPVQYANFLSGAVRLEFGNSIRLRTPAMDLVVERFWNTLRLSILAGSISIVGGIVLGTLAAAKRGTWIDHFGQGIALLGQSMPTFWVSILFIMLFAVQLRWFPVAGMAGWKSYILPGAALGFYGVASIMRMTRSAVIDALGSDSVIFLRAKGLSSGSILFRHALRNAMLPVMTLASLQLVAFISGSVIVETIFAWPGSGRLLVDSVSGRDYPVIQAITFLISVVLVGTNLVVDLSYALIDPRIRRGGAV